MVTSKQWFSTVLVEHNSHGHGHSQRQNSNNANACVEAGEQDVPLTAPYAVKMALSGRCFYDKEHNHAPFADPSVHPEGRALTPAQRQDVIRLASDGLRPTRIVSTMRRQTVSVTPRDVYNLIQAERNRDLADRSPLQALLEKLEGNEAEAP